MATRPRKVRLSPGSYDLLKREASRRGTDPDALAEELLRADLADRAGGDLDATLASLADFRERLPEIDGVALARDARDELQARRT